MGDNAKEKLINWKPAKCPSLQPFSDGSCPWISCKDQTDCDGSCLFGKATCRKGYCIREHMRDGKERSNCRLPRYIAETYKTGYVAILHGEGMYWPVENFVKAVAAFDKK